MDDIAIKVSGVSKKFSRNLKSLMKYGFQDIGRSILGMSVDSGELRGGEFWAVDDVSFEVRRGETLGIIGPNGSGKSTMLKLLNGIYMPDKGKIEINGRVGALIEVGAGFHPMLTGRENIYVNGAILGMCKKEIDENFDDIVEFADIGDFLDSPVRNYSSGMYVRLGFAIAVHTNPEILLVDEILAVGDRDFQIKCYQKMHQIKKRGVSIILVAHNEYTIREQTSKCLYIDKGKVKFLGFTEEVINNYIKDVLENKTQKWVLKESKPSLQMKKAEIKSIKFYDGDMNEVSFIETGQEVNIIFECDVKEKLENAIFGVNFYSNNNFMYCANSDYENIIFNKISLGNVKLKINIPNFYLPQNDYICSATIAEENASNLIDWKDMTDIFVVGRAMNARGSIKLPTKWEIELQ